MLSFRSFECRITTYIYKVNSMQITLSKAESYLDCNFSDSPDPISYQIYVIFIQPSATFIRTRTLNPIFFQHLIHSTSDQPRALIIRIFQNLSKLILILNNFNFTRTRRNPSWARYLNATWLEGVPLGR